MSQLKAKQMKLSAAGGLLIGGTGGTGTTLAAGTGDYILRVVSGAPAWSVNDHLTSATGFNTISATDGTGLVFSVANAAGTAAQKLLTFASGSASDENLKVSTAAGIVTIGAQGTATDVNIVIAPQGNGDVIIGNSGGGIIQSEDGEDLQLKGGQGGGNLFLLGGDAVNGGNAGKIYYAKDATNPQLEIATIGGVASAVAAAATTPGTSIFGGTDTFTLPVKTLQASIRAFVNGVLVEGTAVSYSTTSNAVTFGTGAFAYTLDAADKVVFTYVTTA